jgi:hypothetical protein
MSKRIDVKNGDPDETPPETTGSLSEDLTSDGLESKSASVTVQSIGRAGLIRDGLVSDGLESKDSTAAVKSIRRPGSMREVLNSQEPERKGADLDTNNLLRAASLKSDLPPLPNDQGLPGYAETEKVADPVMKEKDKVKEDDSDKWKIRYSADSEASFI